jgi:hypothetical protein
VGHPNRLSPLEHRLCGGLEQDTAEPDRAGPAAGCAGRHRTGAVQELFHSRNELSHDRSIGVRIIQLAAGGMVALDRDRMGRGNLKLVDHGSPLELGRQGT